MFHLAGEVGKVWRCSCWEEDNVILISEFEDDETWKIWWSILSLSLYSTLNVKLKESIF